MKCHKCGSEDVYVTSSSYVPSGRILLDLTCESCDEAIATGEIKDENWTEIRDGG